MRAVELPGAAVAGAALDRGDEVVHGEATCGHRRGVRLDPHRRLTAEHSDLADAGQNADALRHLCAGVVVQLALGDGVTREREIDDRLIVRVRLRESRRRRQIDGQLPLRL